MQTGNADEAARNMTMNALAAEGALRPVAESEENGWPGGSEEHARHKSAMEGLRVAVPLALGLWALIAGLLWAVLR